MKIHMNEDAVLKAISKHSEDLFPEWKLVGVKYKIGNYEIDALFKTEDDTYVITEVEQASRFYEGVRQLEFYSSLLDRKHGKKPSQCFIVIGKLSDEKIAYCAIKGIELRVIPEKLTPLVFPTSAPNLEQVVYEATENLQNGWYNVKSLTDIVRKRVPGTTVSQAGRILSKLGFKKRRLGTGVQFWVYHTEV